MIIFIKIRVELEFNYFFMEDRRSREESLFERPQPKLVDLKEEITKRIGYDSGLNRKIEIEDRTIPPVQILKRNFFIAGILDELGFTPSNLAQNLFSPEKAEVGFLRVDVKDLYSANLISQDNGDGILNKFAIVLKSAVEEEEERLGDDKKIFSCRWGGDEFCIGIINGQREQLTKSLNSIVSKIEEKIRSQNLEGSYRVGEKDVHQLIGFKSETIFLPDEPKERRVFFYFLSQGQLLSPKEIKEELIKNPQLPEQPLLKTIPYLYNLTILERIKALIKMFPDLEEVINQTSQLNTDQEKDDFLTFLERRLFDRLFTGERILDLTDLIRNIEKYKQLIIFDLKFIKEMNTLLGYEKTNKVLRELW